VGIEGSRTVGRKALQMLAVALALGLWTEGSRAAPPQAPFGDKVSPAIRNYNRASPHIGTSGEYDPRAVAEVKRLGFTAVLDLRGSDETGVAAVAEAARAAGLKYFHIPVTRKAPTDEQVQAFARIAADGANQPLLVNCVSANRVGAMWALYRAAEGVDPEVAIEEGRTVGLKPSREVAVRQRLGLPPMSR
jgi:uncharacterized protein (TIGR01244 family)